ncbi:MAG: DNA repair protein RecO [bacterium]|nr:DNA repair protein RecO [bacterium]
MISRGIVIKKTDIGEDNQLITFYTRDFGKLMGVAKSVKKRTSKQASHLELFNLVDFLLVGAKGHPIVASAQSLEAFVGIKDSLVKSAAGFFLLESFHRLVYDNEKDGRLWNFLEQSLRELNTEELEDKKVTEWMLNLKKELLNILGYERYWDRAEINYFLESLSQKRFFSLDFLNSMAI